MRAHELRSIIEDMAEVPNEELSTDELEAQIGDLAYARAATRDLISKKALQLLEHLHDGGTQ